MGSSAQLLARISADATPFTRAIGEVNQALDKAFAKANASSRGFQALGASLSNLGSSLTLGVTAPLLALGAASVKAATDIDSLKRGLTTVTGSAAATEVEFRKLRETAKLPGIDFEQAVRGSIRLQTLGVSADRAREVMGNFANALAAAGGTKADFGEVVRQLSQLSSQSKVTKENLDPIIDRIPAVAAILKDKFGAEALGEPAKVFEKLGISGKQLADILSDELGKRVPKITGSAQTAFDSFAEAVNEAAGRLGEKFLPSVIATLPKIEALVTAAGEAVDAFTKLPAPIQNVTLTLGALAIASGPIAAVTGRLIAAAAAVKGFAVTLGGLGVTAAGAGVGAAFVGIGAAVAALLTPLLSTQTALENQKRAADEAKKGIDGLTQSYRKQLVATGQLTPSLKGGYESLIEFARGTEASKKATDEQTPAITKAAEAVAKYRVEIVSTYEEDFKTAVLKERLSLLTAEYSKRLTDGVAALVKYKTAANAANAALTELRITEEAPTLRDSTVTDVRRLPRPNGIPGLPTQSNEEALNEQMNRAAGRRNVELAKDAAKEAVDNWKRAQANIRQAVSTIVTDFSRGIADIIVSGGRVGEVFSRIGKQIASTLIRTVIENGINQVIKALGNLLSSLGGVGKAIGGIFGGASSAAGTAIGGIGSAAGSVAGSAAGAAAGGASGVGSAVAGVSSGVLGAVTAIAGVGTLISGIIGNFQSKTMNATLDLIERETRIIRSFVESNTNQINRYLPQLESINQRLIEIRREGITIAGGGGTTVNITVQGSLIGGPNVAAELSQLVIRNLKLQGA